MIKQKGSVQVVVILILAVLVVVAGYFYFAKSKQTSQEVNNQESSNTSSGATQTNQQNVQKTAPTSSITVDLKANDSSKDITISKNEMVIISYDSTGADSCRLIGDAWNNDSPNFKQNQGMGNRGAFTIYPDKTGTYIISCSAGESKDSGSDSIQINIKP